MARFKKSIFLEIWGDVDTLGRLPREVVATPPLEMFKTRLERAWSNLGQWKGMVLVVFKAPSNPNHSMILM